MRVYKRFLLFSSSIVRFTVLCPLTSNSSRDSRMKSSEAQPGTCFPIFLCFLFIPWYGQSFIINNVTDSRRNPERRKSEGSCIRLRERMGHCEYLNRCFLEYGSNFTLAMKHTCTVDKAFVGVCCEHPRHSDENLADVLPTIAVNVRSDSTRIVWEEPSTSAPENPERPKGCGTSSNGRTRLVGGVPAEPGEWPWMVALLRKDRSQFCGGVLVTDRHIITAAHCVNRLQREDIKVRLGEYDLMSEEETRARDFAVSEIRVHPEYDSTSYANDIAIVKLHRPTVFDTYVWPVCLPPVGDTFENKSAVVIGWGMQYYGGPTSTVLMEAQIPIWPQNRCVRSFVQRIDSNVMCAGAYEGGRDACQGDSGGPLLLRLENGRWVNVGIVSWGIRCGEPGIPGIYTRVSSYLDWIFENAVF
ncbi:venom protease [Megachile rotundata]|uniref:venom protease n=1 Tax=Megachile rotundata TaxID=143995 RepID=UPI003FD3EB62